MVVVPSDVSSGSPMRIGVGVRERDGIGGSNEGTLLWSGVGLGKGTELELTKGVERTDVRCNSGEVDETKLGEGETVVWKDGEGETGAVVWKDGVWKDGEGETGAVVWKDGEGDTGAVVWKDGESNKLVVVGGNSPEEAVLGFRGGEVYGIKKGEFTPSIENGTVVTAVTMDTSPLTVAGSSRPFDSPTVLELVMGANGDD